ncbi:MAG: PH domain-containing protein [bacterium]|nr:PH domain-containing protein [bacterium]
MEKKSVIKEVKEFKSKYGMTIAWRLKKNAKVIEKHLNPDEEVLYVFAAQKNNNCFDIFSTAVVALTNKRLVIGRKRVVFGYFFSSITPDLFNDLKVLSGIIWGKIHIDTVKEFVTLSNIDKKALPEIETKISSYMMDEKSKLLENIDQK